MRFLKKYYGHLVIVVLALGVGGVLKLTTQSDKPKTVEDFAKTSAMIVMDGNMSGGSGVVLTSDKDGSIILTNMHVCEVIQAGGLVVNLDTAYRIKQYKLYKKHDLCLIKIAENLNVSSIVAKEPVKKYSHVYVSGHPALLPHVLTEGYFGDYRTIPILVDIKECKTDEQFKRHPIECLFFGGIPVTRSFDAQLVTATIMPGSSGSGVFNEEGEIAGLIFAGSAQGLSYGFIVPLSYIQDFLTNQENLPWQTPKKASRKKFMQLSTTKRIYIACQGKAYYSVYCNSLELE